MRTIYIIIPLFLSVLQIQANSADCRLPARPIDTARFEPFFEKHAAFKEFKKEVWQLYKKNNYQFIWYDDLGLNEYAHIAYDELSLIDENGIFSIIPYYRELNEVFIHENSIPNTDAELIITTVVLFYSKRVYSGISVQESRLSGWLLARENSDYCSYLDKLISVTEPSKAERPELFSQYYALKKVLQNYRNIQDKGGWRTITYNKEFKELIPGDSSIVAAEVRTRLFNEGLLQKDSGKLLFDKDLHEAILQYNVIHRREGESKITADLIKELNISVDERIMCIAVNMERCRWIPPKLNHVAEFIAVNIPSYELHYLREGKPLLSSKVVVGKEATKTVVFSGELSHIIFNPYWNIPQSILQKEIIPEIKKQPGYLKKHAMEWNGNNLRQKPGPDNPLGSVKFIFPNSNSIYLHDTPSKKFFLRKDRAYSHGCIRVEKARELAIAILKKEGDWNENKVDRLMHTGKQTVYTIKNKIPVYIAYFTAWVDDKGNIAFYKDIYNRDQRLAKLLYQ